MLASVGFDGAGQGSAELTYFLGDAPGDVGQDLFESTIESALKVWSDVADITFTETSQASLPDSLDITFRRLDGAGGTLAQAYFPDDVNPQRIAGDVQFDSSESWEVGNAQGSQAFDLLHVAVHEIGHALGLDHDTTVGSVLAATVSPQTQFTSLDQSDIDAILELYAPAVAVEVETPVVDPDPVEPDEPVVDTPDEQTPTDSSDPIPDDDEEENPADTEDEEPEETDPNEEFRRRFQRFINQWLRRLRQFRFSFRFR